MGHQFAVHGANNAGQQLVLHGAIIDEQVLMNCRSPRMGRQTGPTLYLHTVALKGNRAGVIQKLLSQDLTNPRLIRLVFVGRCL